MSRAKFSVRILVTDTNAVVGFEPKFFRWAKGKGFFMTDPPDHVVTFGKTVLVKILDPMCTVFNSRRTADMGVDAINAALRRRLPAGSRYDVTVYWDQTKKPRKKKPKRRSPRSGTP